MKDEKEINVSVAKLLGWQDVQPSDSHMHTHIGIDPSDGCLDGIPDFFEDANTRPEMLASLTEEEIFEVVKACKTTEGNWWSASDFAALMRLDQPSFARLYCKIKGTL